MSKRQSGTSTKQLGDINRNNQVLVARTEAKGNDHNQYVWVLECSGKLGTGEVCRHRYGANGSDFHLRKCPSCQGGAPGLSIEGLI
jgi:hypothetical protein